MRQVGVADSLMVAARLVPVVAGGLSRFGRAQTRGSAHFVVTAFSEAQPSKSWWLTVSYRSLVRPGSVRFAGYVVDAGGGG